MIKILIVDDHTIVRRGLFQILNEGFPNSIIEEAVDALSMIKELGKKDFDVIISDLSMPGTSGLEAIPQIKKINPNIPVLIMSIHSEDQYAIRVLKAGAAGFLNKNLAPEELVIAVKRVLQGKKYITANIAEKLANHVEIDKSEPLHYYLSDREINVLKYIVNGTSITDIAKNLFLSVTTVSTYRSRILLKLKLKTNADLIIYAIEHNLVNQG
jgi:DNA-binding NarL/FixJ family response regulator